MQVGDAFLRIELPFSEARGLSPYTNDTSTPSALGFRNGILSRGSACPYPCAYGYG